MHHLSPKPDQATSPAESLIVYPLRFPIKVMGLADDRFLPAILDIVRLHDANFSAEHIAARYSSSGKFISLTLHPWISGRSQLDALYRELTGHPLVRYAL